MQPIILIDPAVLKLKSTIDQYKNKFLAVFLAGQLTTQKREDQMSLSLQDIKDELRESYLRTEEVLSGMDAYIGKQDRRIEVLEGRIAVVERQMTAIIDALREDSSPPEPKPPQIYTGR